MADTQYMTKEGERWDTVSYKAYGKSSLFQTIIENNPAIPITPKLPAGTVLNIPILADGVVLTDKELVPIWKK